MVDWSLLIRLVPATFSYKRDNLRFPTLKRILMVILFYLLFIIVFTVNRVFLLLDEILFPWYRWQRTDKVVFIAGIPRSATSFLLEKLSDDNDSFTVMKLWEMLFAPSILQKFIFLGFISIDRLIGRPFLWLSRGLDKVMFGGLSGIHDMALSKAEEDEAILLWSFTSLYLYYFFPDHEALRPYLNFDEGLSVGKRRWVMRQYRNYLQRHNFVFNRKETRYLIAKNPAYVPKMRSLAQAFPNAKLLYPLRSPLKTVPAYIGLNDHVVKAFTSKHQHERMKTETVHLLLDWYEMGEKALDKSWQANGMVLPFQSITKDTFNTFEGIYNFLDISMSETAAQRIRDVEAASKKYKSKHVYKDVSEEMKEEIRERVGHLIPS